MKDEIESKYEVKVDELNLSDFVKSIQVDSALIFHDKHDKVLPIARSRNVHQNWPQSKMIEIENTGHFRILRDRGVINQLVQYITTED